MNRRTFVHALGGGLLAAPVAARAQGRKMARVGWVGAWYSPSGAATFLEAFRQGMRDRGYIEGQNLTIDARWMEGVSPEVVAVVRQLVANLGVRVEPLTAAIAEHAAKLRARERKLRLPDALVLATGDVLDATVLTCDRAWLRIDRRARIV